MSGAIPQIKRADSQIPRSTRRQSPGFHRLHFHYQLLGIRKIGKIERHWHIFFGKGRQVKNERTGISTSGKPLFMVSFPGADSETRPPVFRRMAAPHPSAVRRQRTTRANGAAAIPRGRRHPGSLGGTAPVHGRGRPSSFHESADEDRRTSLRPIRHTERRSPGTFPFLRSSNSNTNCGKCRLVAKSRVFQPFKRDPQARPVSH